jgi:hypothetical protein
MPALLLRGAGAGLIATAAMSGVMLAARRLGLTPTLPPERIVQESAEAAGATAEPEQIDALAGIAHLAFGAAGGALLAAVSRLIGPRLSAALALPWALVIWAGSYFGWVPALHILPPPPKDHPGRAWTMLVAHLVYGAVLAALWRLGGRGVRA